MHTAAHGSAEPAPDGRPGVRQRPGAPAARSGWWHPRLRRARRRRRRARPAARCPVVADAAFRQGPPARGLQLPPAAVVHVAGRPARPVAQERHPGAPLAQVRRCCSGSSLRAAAALSLRRSTAVSSEISALCWWLSRQGSQSAEGAPRVTNEALIRCEERLREHIYALIEGADYDSLSRSWCDLPAVGTSAFPTARRSSSSLHSEGALPPADRRACWLLQEGAAEELIHPEAPVAAGARGA